MPRSLLILHWKFFVSVILVLVVTILTYCACRKLQKPSSKALLKRSASVGERLPQNKRQAAGKAHVGEKEDVVPASKISKARDFGPKKQDWQSHQEQKQMTAVE